MQYMLKPIVSKRMQFELTSMQAWLFYRHVKANLTSLFWNASIDAQAALALA